MSSHRVGTGYRLARWDAQGLRQQNDAARQPAPTRFFLNRYAGRQPMDFDTYFDRLVLREGDWLRPAKVVLEPYWAQVRPELDRAARDLYKDVVGKPPDDDWQGVDEWFYLANRDLDHRRPIDLMATPEGVLFARCSCG